MHYNLSSPCGSGPAFWTWLVTQVFRVGSEVGAAEIGEAVADFYAADGQQPSRASVERCATAFLGSYWRSDGFGALGLLKPLGHGRYLVSEPSPPSSWVVGYALSDYWARLAEDRQEIPLRDLSAEGGFASLLFISSGFLGGALAELQAAGLILLKRDAPPFTVVRLWRDDSVFLERLYE
jgi:hypothetical protein